MPRYKIKCIIKYNQYIYLHKSRIFCILIEISAQDPPLHLYICFFLYIWLYIYIYLHIYIYIRNYNSQVSIFPVQKTKPTYKPTSENKVLQARKLKYNKLKGLASSATNGSSYISKQADKPNQHSAPSVRTLSPADLQGIYPTVALPAPRHENSRCAHAQRDATRSSAVQVLGFRSADNNQAIMQRKSRSHSRAILLYA